MDKSADFIIVGAGYAGLMSALTLARGGKTVMVVEAQPIGGNDSLMPCHTQSAISGGHVVSGFSQDFNKLEKKYGLDYARRLFQLSIDGIDLVESMCHEIGGAGFRRGYLILSRNERDDQELETYIEETKKFGRAGAHAHLLTPDETKSYICSADFQHKGAYSLLSGQLEPRDYLKGLALLAEKAGVKFLPLTRVKSFSITKEGVQLITDKDETLSAGKVIISGGTGILRSGFFPEMRKYQAVIGNYALKTEVLPHSLIHQIFPSGYKGAFCDMRRTDVLYARLDNQNRLDFGAYSFSGNRPNANAVERLLYQTFPQLKLAGIGIQQGRYGFLCGTKLETMQMFQSTEAGDVRPSHSFRKESSVTILSAFGGAGINLGTISGLAVAEAYLGQPEKLNLLARIEHPKLPFTLPWEKANQWRDYALTKALSVVDRGASRNGIWGMLMRIAQNMI
jgi:gamma-glutamylputrescine oxidase